MKTIRITFWTLLAALTVLWIVATLPPTEPLGFIAVRNMLVQYSGVLTIGVMSAAMILATRSPLLDRWLNGLDKAYRLHKWLGVAALSAAVVHWLAAQGPKWAVASGLVAAPDRGPRPEASDVASVEGVLQALRGPAEMLGKWAFYAAAALIIVALTKRIPYRFFAATHTLLAAFYLVLVFHAVVLMDQGAWTQPVGIVVALLMIGGVLAAVLALTRRIGRARRFAGTIAALRHFPSMKITQADIVVDESWPGHEAGQFAFVTFDPREGAHPFTIASAWEPATRTVRVISKGLGDYTERLPEALAIGDDVAVEGPYGRFTFDDAKPRQIWVGAGIGVTPFIARLKHLAAGSDGKRIDLIHCVPDIAPEAQSLLEADVSAAGVALHLMRDDQDGLLSGARLRAMLPDWSAASVWFCGPAAFGETLRVDLVANGLSPADFHQELFSMR